MREYGNISILGSLRCLPKRTSFSYSVPGIHALIECDKVIYPLGWRAWTLDWRPSICLQCQARSPQQTICTKEVFHWKLSQTRALCAMRSQNLLVIFSYIASSPGIISGVISGAGAVLSGAAPHHCRKFPSRGALEDFVVL